MLKLTVPKPCHQDWDAMTPNEQGRHCTICAKTVVDFTVMTDDELKNYLLHTQEQKTCGRFKQSQLQHISIHLPENIFTQPLPFWKHFLAACLLAFGMMLFSCNTTTKGEPLLDVKTITIPKDDTGLLLGKPNLPPPPIVRHTLGALRFAVINEEVVQGGLEVELPVDSTPPLMTDQVDIELSTDSLRNQPDTIRVNDGAADTTHCDHIIYY